MLRKAINNYVSKLKGNSYRIDERIPASYLYNLAFNSMLRKFRGLLSGLKSEKAPFIGKGVTVKASHNFISGRGLVIGNYCYIDALSTNGIKVGHNVSIGRNTIIECTGNFQFLGKGLLVGNNVGLGTDNFYGCAGGIEIGDDTIIGNFVSFHSENHVHADLGSPIRLQGVTHDGIKIGKNCWIGAKVTILDGAILGDGSIVAAGAVLIAGKYEDNGIYGGIPAKLIKFRQ
jgi:acetyltransferase-like isoleucine patch superfamily enzyme